MLWLWIALGILGVALTAATAFHLHILRNHMPFLVRVFQEKPLFIIPFAPPSDDAEEVDLITADGLTLKGCYLKHAGPRKGVILFGPEFGASRWGCIPYCEFLRQSGYDIFTFEMRGQGQSQAQAGYEPLQWLTEYEIEDFQTALEYLRRRADAEPRGIGLFGLSKGGSAGLWIAAHDPYVRCIVTDGAFGTISTMVPYMKQWIYIYSRAPWVVKLIPHWYYVWAAYIGIGRISRIRNARYPVLENVVRRIAPRPWLMIHGGADNYIKPASARDLFARAGEPKELWLVDKAKHNQAIQTAGGDYQRRVRDFFDKHLSDAAPAGREGVAAPAGQASPNGAATKERSPRAVKV
ncbi:MAG: alpha/beta fold hydrolase [Gemmataceae bacterium]|nr:alpha/beta fold hydrolase [Gemmataceae bacterium]